jgi:hypothetical protein
MYVNVGIFTEVKIQIVVVWIMISSRSLIGKHQNFKEHTFLLPSDFNPEDGVSMFN